MIQKGVISISTKYDSLWKKRKIKLKEKGWVWNKTYQMWDSPNGNAEWTDDLKLMNDEEFEKCLDT